MFEIPVIRDALDQVRPSFTVSLPLPTRHYDLTFRWNARAATWFCDIAVTGIGDVALGLPVRVGSMINNFWRAGMPPGFLYVRDRQTPSTDPGRYDLGDRVRVYFIGAAEL